MSGLSVCILGGSGFVGRAIVRRLVREGHTATIVARRPERQRDLLVLPPVKLVGGDVYNPVFLQRQFRGMDAVINLIGILNERGRDGREFQRVHAALPVSIVGACKHAGVARYLHMSALNASPQGPSFYLRTKGEGEIAAHAAASGGLRVTSFRPSVIFGPGDSFINRFARLLRFTPWVFPLACPGARFAPVFVNDVAGAFIKAIDDPDTFGGRYDLCGPKVYTLKQLVEYTGELIGARRRIIGLPDWMSKLQAAMLEIVPGKPFSLDNYRSLQLDSVCLRGFPAIFNFNPSALEAIAPTYVTKPLGSQF